MKKNSNYIPIYLERIVCRALSILFLATWITNISAQPLVMLERSNESILEAPAFEKIPLFRIQVRITLADVEDAGTDDDVLH
jgi:hypothetical protein